MKKILFLILLLNGIISLSAQTEDLMEQVINLTGLEENNFLIQGFSQVDRARYLSLEFQDMAYFAMDIPLRRGVVALSPVTLINLFLKSGLEENDRVLLVGEECSYYATALSRAGMEIFLIDPTADVSSSYSLKKDKDNLNGWISMAPFDFIAVLNPLEEIPYQLINQLSNGGIMIIPLIAPDFLQCWFQVKSLGSENKMSMLGSASVYPLF